MSGSSRSKLESAFRECELHAEILAEDLDEHGEPAYSAASIEALTRHRLRLLDQMAYRFTKLQATLGEQVLPMLLDLAEEPLASDAPFAQKLQRLERIGIIPSAEQWRELRIARNTIAHEYPDAPELKAAALNQFVRSADDLLQFWEHVADQARQLG
ncbi:hypothetical protein [Wenzhouxiangella sp. EGI_FJ10409]|uniref:hypothetical protein n=1 Tax=Wenzhouxiangella sp. EGI_FJ10409 TaxID=3243767 RepID=UPI0035D5FACD